MEDTLIQFIEKVVMEEQSSLIKLINDSHVLCVDGKDRSASYLRDMARVYPVVYFKIYKSPWTTFSKSLVPEGHVAFAKFDASINATTDKWTGYVITLDIAGITISKKKNHARFDLIDGSFHKIMEEE